MKARWVILIVTLVLISYLIISTLGPHWRGSDAAPPTPTWTPYPSDTPATVATETVLSATSTVTSAHLPTAGPLERPTETPTLPVDGDTQIAPTLEPSHADTPLIHVVAPGDMLITIATRYEVEIDDIVQANGLRSADIIYVGQQLVIPATPTIPPSDNSEATPTATSTPFTRSFVHLVQAGETLAVITHKYGVTAEAVIEANGLRSADWIFIGQQLIIPVPPATATPASALSSRTHTVKAGETLTGIAMQYGIPIEAIMRENSITSPDTIYVGQTLIIP